MSYIHLCVFGARAHTNIVLVIPVAKQVDQHVALVMLVSHLRKIVLSR